MGGANNGGINIFLTSSWNLDAGEVLSALEVLGAALRALLEHDRWLLNEMSILR